MLSSMPQTLIRWRLREVMARYHIKGVDLASQLGVSGNSISNLRNSKSMPRIDGDALNNLCNALNKLALDLDREITPSTLIEYTRDLEPEKKFSPVSASQSPKINPNNQFNNEKMNDNPTKLIVITGGKLVSQHNSCDLI